MVNTTASLTSLKNLLVTRQNQFAIHFRDEKHVSIFFLCNNLTRVLDISFCVWWLPYLKGVYFRKLDTSGLSIVCYRSRFLCMYVFCNNNWFFCVFFTANNDNRIFVAIPRFQPGVPVALGVITDKVHDGNPVITPYPSWRWHRDPRICSSDRIVSVYRIQVKRIQVFQSKIDVFFSFCLL